MKLYVNRFCHTSNMKRKLILHYHIYKNAGSSIDSILKDSFGSAWYNWDKPSGKGGIILPYEIEEFISANQNILALSSHEAVLPIPRGDFEVYPVLFLRHPIVRARSVYLFEWKKELGLEEPRGSFSEFLQENLIDKKRSVVSNFQVAKLSNLIYGKEFELKPLREFEKLERAKLTLTTLPYFGLVEHFHQSLVRLHYYLRFSFPELLIVNHQKNVTQDPKKELEESLKDIQGELGATMYKELCDRNSLDLNLYSFAVQKYFSIAKIV